MANVFTHYTLLSQSFSQKDVKIGTGMSASAGHRLRAISMYRSGTCVPLALPAWSCCAVIVPRQAHVQRVFHREAQATNLLHTIVNMSAAVKLIHNHRK